MDTITQCSGLRGSVMLKWSYENEIYQHTLSVRGFRVQISSPHLEEQ